MLPDTQPLWPRDLAKGAVPAPRGMAALGQAVSPWQHCHSHALTFVSSPSGAAKAAAARAGREQGWHGARSSRDAGPGWHRAHGAGSRGGTSRSAAARGHGWPRQSRRWHTPPSVRSHAGLGWPFWDRGGCVGSSACVTKALPLGPASYEQDHLSDFQ